MDRPNDPRGGCGESKRVRDEFNGFYRCLVSNNTPFHRNTFFIHVFVPSKYLHMHYMCRKPNGRNLQKMKPQKCQIRTFKTGLDRCIMSSENENRTHTQHTRETLLDTIHNNNNISQKIKIKIHTTPNKKQPCHPP